MALWLLSPDRKCSDPFWLMLRDQSSAACNSYVCYTDGTTLDNILFLTHPILILSTGASLCYVVLGILYKAKKKYYVEVISVNLSHCLNPWIYFFKIQYGRLVLNVSEQIRFSTILSDDKVHFT